MQGRTARNEDTLETGRPCWRLLKGHKLSKDVGDTDSRDMQEAEFKSFGDQLYKVEEIT